MTTQPVKANLGKKGKGGWGICALLYSLNNLSKKQTLPLYSLTYSLQGSFGPQGKVQGLKWLSPATGGKARPLEGRPPILPQLTYPC